MAMEDRRFTDIETANPFAMRDPDPVTCHREEGRKAVEIAHATDLEAIAGYLGRFQSVLVECDKALMDFIVGSLFAGKLLPKARPEYVTVNNVVPRPPDSALDHLTADLVAKLRDNLGRRDRVVVIRHLDLMTWTTDDRPRPVVNDIVYWLQEYSTAVKLAFWDPIFPLPKIAEALFPNRVRVSSFDRGVLWRLLAPDEARKVSTDYAFLKVSDQSTLYQYLAGTNVVEVRRILRALADDPALVKTPVDSGPVYEFIRCQTGAVPLSPGGTLAGYDDVREQLKRLVIFPVALRREAATEEELRWADSLVPRGLILDGPPGTGKTEWARWLAGQLNTPLFVIHGPELRSKYVGDTEAAIRRIWTAARRAAPSVILIDEVDSIAPSRAGRDASNFERSMVNTLLTEMNGLRREECVIVVGTTNRFADVDDALKRPGRCQRIAIPYPGEADRRAILKHYSDACRLGLSEADVERLVASTGDGFSGDHLRAVCQHIAVERQYRQRLGAASPEMTERMGPFTPEDAVEAVRCSFEKKPPDDGGPAEAGTRTPDRGTRWRERRER